MTVPNLVIVGAPKCGTTSLFAWLAAHPAVCGSSVKETRYLLDPDDPLFKIKSNYRDYGLAGYHSYFSACETASAPIVLEATPVYLYQHTAPSVLAGLTPVPRIIFVFRKPSERVYSHYQFLRNNKIVLDSALTLREFVELNKSRDPRLPVRGHAREVVAQSRYVDYLDRWSTRFPRAHLLAFLFEHLRRDPRGFMRDVAERLDIDPSFYDSYDFPQENVTYEIRSRWIHRSRKLLGRRLRPRMRNALKRVAETTYSHINVKPASRSRTSEDSDVLLELEREFLPYNERLADELQLDISPWLSGAITLNAAAHDAS